jgi:hypothetical protein
MLKYTINYDVEVMLYMTLIAAMPIIIYKKENGTGFKTAKRRMPIEVRELILSLAVICWEATPKNRLIASVERM